MASSVTGKDGKNATADEAAESARPENESAAPEERELEGGDAGKAAPADYKPAAAAAAAGRGFFTIYKKGQGYWTRMGTVAGAALLALLTAQFLYQQGRVWFQAANGRPNMPVVLGLVVGFLAVFSLIVFRIINKPSVADFLIATDSEMKKVNWTTKAELIGSTKVVIGFMFVIAILLFTFDTVFGFVFHWLRVLAFPPF
jgi:preprotein translocase subunit SecE